MFAFLFVCASAGLFYVRKQIKTAYDLFRIYRNTVDPDGKKGVLRILPSFAMIGLLQWLASQPSVIPKIEPDRFNRTHLRISYSYKDRPYYYLLKIPKGVSPLNSIKDENDADISENISPYLGPNLDCHNVALYPKDFGYKKMTITTAYDEQIVFEEDDQIIL